jgi:hypothetical protein
MIVIEFPAARCESQPGGFSFWEMPAKPAGECRLAFGNGRGDF